MSQLLLLGESLVDSLQFLVQVGQSLHGVGSHPFQSLLHHVVLSGQGRILRVRELLLQLPRSLLAPGADCTY
ncbi:hypothetical protein WQO_33600 [Streptomyces globisporus C-1027]|uniref:Uncharacterized protein n=1 Tax=Streptomyces globisporus C-1027 TaxID=1172567 RepID=A0A0U3MCE7_STRGL|nr:hypothetical protein WQO_33600 [Streptomyces globisporus C-1027]